MGDVSLAAITAIKDAEQEGFIAGTLHAQGWNITHRVLDFGDLQIALSHCSQPLPILLISLDLAGFSASHIAEFRSRGFTVFLFSSNVDQESELSGASNFPSTALELMAIIRGSLRAPMVRATRASITRTARTIAISTASHGAGSTLVAINLATELSLLGYKTLLVDSDCSAPAISTLLGHRGLRDNVLRIAENLWATEISQDNLAADINRLHEAQSQYQYLVLDLGTIKNFAASLTSRRWESEILIWVSHNADQLCFVTRDTKIALERLRGVLRECAQNSIRPAISIIHNMRTPGKKSDRDESLLQSIKPIPHSEILQIPFDPRSAQRAENNNSSLYEVNEKSALRRSITEIAGRFAQ